MSRAGVTLANSPAAWHAGNGLTDPAIQYGAYGDFAFEHGLISQDVHRRINAAFPACKCDAAHLAHLARPHAAV